MYTRTRRVPKAAEAAWRPAVPRVLTHPPTLPPPASLNPVKPVQQFLSEIVSLMQLHFVFSDMKEILMLIIKGMCSKRQAAHASGM